MLQANFLTLIFIVVFILPIVMGAFTKFSRDKIQYSLWSLGDGLEFILALLLAIYLTRGIFFQHSPGLFAQIYNGIPEEIRIQLLGQDILIYIIVVPLIVWLFRSLLRLITGPIYKVGLGPLANRLYTRLIAMGSGLGRIIGALAQVPRAAVLVFVGALLLNFYAYYFPSPTLAQVMSESSGYQLIYKNAVSPLLDSNLARKIPVLVNDSFRQNTVGVPTQSRVITYFNGVTLDEAVKSNSQIDATARQVVGSEQNSRQKAYLLYRWVSQNIKYDDQKAVQLSQDPSGIASGSIMAFNTRTGVCFDYASLYVSMCRAVGLKVRLVSGLGYSGLTWGDHAWNQVYVPEESRWVNVDPTFGTVSNYFDKPDFSVDHKDAEVQGEW
jgi:hypothetical protein